MRESTSIRKTVEQLRRRHEQIADDRDFGKGSLGDEELTALLVVSYPTLSGQLN
jgi:hypothetical protein